MREPICTHGILTYGNSMVWLVGYWSGAIFCKVTDQHFESRAKADAWRRAA